MLNKHNLATVAEFVGSDGRYKLSSINVTDRETIAMNGYYLVRVTMPKVADSTESLEGVVPFLLDAKQAKAIGKSIGKDEMASCALNGDEGGRTISVPNGTKFHVPKVESTFPTVDALMPSGDPSLVIGLNANYLMKLARAFSQFQSEKRSPVIKLSFYGADKSVKMVKMEAENDAGQTITALLMPERL